MTDDGLNNSHRQHWLCGFASSSFFFFKQNLKIIGTNLIHKPLSVSLIHFSSVCKKISKGGILGSKKEQKQQNDEKQWEKSTVWKPVGTRFR